MRLVLWDEGGLSTPPVQVGEQLPDDVLAAVYAAPQRWVRANMVSTLDGAAVDAHGVSGGINTPADQRVFGLLRALADVVVIGAGTARAEGYSRISVDPGWLAARTTAGLTRPPVLAIPTSSAELPDSLLAPSPDGGELLVLAGPDAPVGALGGLRRRLGAEHVLSFEAPLTPAVILTAFAERGLTRVLLEGGPSLLQAVLAADALDELCLTWTPLLIGGPSGRIVSGEHLRTTARPLALIEEAGTVLGRWSVRSLHLAGTQER